MSAVNLSDDAPVCVCVVPAYRPETIACNRACLPCSWYSLLVTLLPEILPAGVSIVCVTQESHWHI